ncbi:MAG: hypothetical protein M1812_000667 [Candelaria pacifica]|nr:MAG: hypothetical protein M1812_000667 [Candelaria pacifica]
MHISTRLSYLKDQPIYKTERPFMLMTNVPQGQRVSNLRWELGQEETIHDVRGREPEFSLDESGFRYIDCPTRFTDWTDKKEIERVYLAEMESVLKKNVDNVDLIKIFDWRMRKKMDACESDQVYDLNMQTDMLNPAEHVHCDQTASGVITRIQSMMGDEAELLLQGRVRVINLWRPIRHTVEDCPITICDGSTILESDLVECDRVRKYWVGTMGLVEYRPGFKWYYMSRQSPDDVLIFKNFDSEENVRAKCCPHTAFDIDNIPAGTPTRESIEIRALVFTYPDHI